MNGLFCQNVNFACRPVKLAREREVLEPGVCTRTRSLAASDGSTACQVILGAAGVNSHDV